MKGVSEIDLKIQEKSVFSNFYKSNLKVGDVVYDIGAYRGVTAKGFADLGFQVHAFEGSPLNIPFLIENTKDLNVIVHPVAIHTKQYSVKTKFNDCNHPSGFHPEQEVNYVTLDSYCDKLPVPALVKMDIEGMESVVLLKANKLIFEYKPIWQLSIHPNQIGYGPDYPGWVWKDQGGFDFDILFDIYEVFDENLNKVSSLYSFGEFILKPK